MKYKVTAKKTDNQEKTGCWPLAALFSGIFTLVVTYFWPNAIPFSFFEFWKFDFSIWEVLLVSWPVFLWGFLFNLVIFLLIPKPSLMAESAESVLACGTLISVWAGIAEEIAFRWLFFYSAMIGTQIVNYLFFGFLGFGVAEFIYTNIMSHFFNLITLGLMSQIFFHPAGWFVGAAVSISNGKFRDGHLYQGVLGWLNAWIIGFFLYYLMFTYGLPAAILIHFLFDLMIFFLLYLGLVIKRSFGSHH